MALNPRTGELDDPGAALKVRRILACEFFKKALEYFEKTQDVLIFEFGPIGLKISTESQTETAHWVPLEKMPSSSMYDDKAGFIVWRRWFAEELLSYAEKQRSVSMQGAIPKELWTHELKVNSTQELLNLVQVICPIQYPLMEKECLERRHFSIAERNGVPLVAL